MTSAEDDFGSTSANPTINGTNSFNRRANSSSSNPQTPSNSMELRLLMTSRDAGAVIGESLDRFERVREL
jgi:hypothetical protein